MDEEKTVFEKIIDGELPSSKVYEDEKALVILDIHPVNKGHALVIPKKRYSNIYDIPEELFAHLAIIAKKVAIAIKETTRAEGINIIMNNERSADQLIENHAHIHVIPRFSSDGYKPWRGAETYIDSEKNKLASDIAAMIP